MTTQTAEFLGLGFYFYQSVIARSVLSGAAFFPGTARQGRCAAESKDRDEAISADWLEIASLRSQ